MSTSNNRASTPPAPTETKGQRRKLAKTVHAAAAAAAASAATLTDGVSVVSDTMEDVLPVAPDSSLSVSARKELIETGRHFSKIASRFSFEDNTPSYNTWVIQFKAEAENCSLEGTLAGPLTGSALDSLQQKTVYNIILSFRGAIRADCERASSSWPTQGGPCEESSLHGSH